MAKGLLGAMGGHIDIESELFDNSTFLRFGFYLMIPVASGVGGAFVERLLSSLLD